MLEQAVAVLYTLFSVLKNVVFRGVLLPGPTCKNIRFDETDSDPYVVLTKQLYMKLALFSKGFIDCPFDLFCMFVQETQRTKQQHVLCFSWNSWIWQF